MHGQRSRALPPATSCASGRSGLRQAHISSSTRKRSGLGMPAPSEVDFRTVSSDASCRFAVSGCRSECKTTYKSRNQSREAGTSSRILTAWKLLPNISGWVLQTIEKGHQYSLGLAPQVYRGVFHRGGPPAGSGNRTRSESSVRERGHRICSSLKQGNWALQPVFHSSKEGWGLCPILDLHVLNDSVVQLKFKKLTLRQIVPQVRSEDWFVTIDLKDAYFHISILPYHKKFLRFAFGGRAYQYQVLPFGLALSPHTFTKCVDAALKPLCLQGIRIMNYFEYWFILAQSHQLIVRNRDADLAHMKDLGLRLNAKKSVLFETFR